MTHVIGGLEGGTVLRHLLASLAYRANRALEGAPEGFADFEAGEDVMTPRQIINHCAVILGYANAQLAASEFTKTEIENWNAEVERFFMALADLDQTIESRLQADRETVLKMLQGPLLDAFTHVGQLNMLRRLAGSPVPRTNFIKATIEVGQLKQDTEHV